MATLFSYFKKSPKTTNNGKIKNKELSSKSDGINEKSKLNTKFKVEEKPIGCTTTQTTEKEHTTLTFSVGEIVWADLEGFPWWPAMICEHPSSKTYLKHDNDEEKIHVQFFGEPPTRDWVLKRCIEGFEERKPTSESDVKYAFDAAKRALKLDISQRVQVYYACRLSDEEEDSNGEGAIRIIKRAKKRSNGNDTHKNPTKRLKVFDDSDEEVDLDNKGGDDSSYEPDDNDDTADDDYQSEASEDEDYMSEASEEESIETSKKRKRKASISKADTATTAEKRKSVLSNITNCSTPLFSKLNNSISKAQSSLAKFSPTVAASPPTFDIVDKQDFVHYGLEFLRDGKRKDKAMKLHTGPNYDPRTLHVPQSYIDSKIVTPGMKQWWTLKRDLFDTIIFFKVGKFYELYHMDAVVGVKELGLLYMKGQFAHCGFPEIAFSRYSEVLIQRGYKVARIEQTETPQELSARNGGKVVRREVCAVISKGTRTFSFMEGQSDENNSNYLLALVERPSNEICLGGSEFGVCFIDTSIGKFHLGQFTDDRQSSRFLTMISQYPPAQVLFERNRISPKIQHILKHELLPTIKEALVPGSEFWTAPKTLKHLHEKNYFNDESKSGPFEWPACLTKMLSDGDTLGLEPCEKYQHAISALGACTWHLKKCCIDQELLSMSQFEEYTPSDIVVEKRASSTTLPQHMILDGVTLTNLDIVINTEGTTEGTLMELLDHCTTTFGKRYFKQWLCMPSCNKRAIQSRLDAVEDLMKLSSVISDIQSAMKTMPDLERLLRRIHSLGSLRRSNDHPDSRAIFYNEETYSKKKISDLLSAIEGFHKAEKVIGLLQQNLSSLSSPMLKSLLHKDPDENDKGRFPDLMPTLKFFQHAFNHKVARETGTIHPKPGVLTEYDDAIADLQSIEEKLDDYLKQQRKRLGCQGIKYWGTGKNRHQLEIPESAIRSSVPNDYHLKSQKKGFKRYISDSIEELNEDLVSAEERRDAALKDTMRNIFNKFDKEHAIWEKAVRCLATIDCLMSLAHYSSNLDGISCRPEIIDPIDTDGKEIQPFFEILNCRHPCAQQSLAGGDFIPNDIILGKEETTGNKREMSPCCVLVTGPNMGGKSTLMRQAGVILIMAQLGCYVPAEVCRFTPVDRIFTRLGARDRILHGESTFFVELSETSTIFQHATKHSLVLLDELGRGTATYDGTAIASAVVFDLANRLCCRTLFSTHYHTLVDDFSKERNIKLGHMACMVEKEDEENDDPSQETITFLYKFATGACPKSYGFNAAKLAGLPMSVIKKAHHKAVEFEESSRNTRFFRKILVSPIDQVKDMISLFKM